jgi:hypothetical protein
MHTHSIVHYVCSFGPKKLSLTQSCIICAHLALNSYHSLNHALYMLIWPQQAITNSIMHYICSFCLKKLSLTQSCIIYAHLALKSYHSPTLSYNIHNIVSNIFHQWGEYSSKLLVASTAFPSLHPLRIVKTCIFITKSYIIFTARPWHVRGLSLTCLSHVRRMSVARPWHVK